MGVAGMLRPWRAAVQARLPDLHGHQIDALATASWAMAQAGSCRLSEMAVMTPGSALRQSSERRWQRFVDNPRVDTRSVSAAWAQDLLAEAGPITLLLDETPQANHLRAMKLSRQTAGRALPLLWRCYRPGESPQTLDRLVIGLLREANQLLPDSARPTLLTDRGLSWPAVLDFCVGHGWHYLMRVQGQTRATLSGGPEVSLSALIKKRGDAWCGPVRVFKKAKWREANVVAHWAPDADEPWFLITDLPANLCRCGQYAKRMRQEQSFRDEKSSGLGWGRSLVRDPEHADRLLLIMAMAMTWLIQIGLAIIRGGQRHQWERPDRRTLSVFQLGLRFIQRSLLFSRDSPQI